MKYLSNLNDELLKLGPYGSFTLRQACAAVHATGRIGSGKTTAFETLARAYLRAGMGGWVTITKPADIPMWQKYSREENRDRSLGIFDEGEGLNVLSYLFARHGVAGIGTVTDSLMRILEAVKRASSTMSKRGEEPFFEDWKRVLLRFATLPLYSAQRELSFSDIIRFIESAPKSAKEVTDPQWQSQSFMYRIIVMAMQSPKIPLPPDVLRDNIEFWTKGYAEIPDRTRGNVVATVVGALDRFRHGRLKTILGGRTTLVPEMAFHGMVTVFAMPTLTWGEDGIIAQQILKTLWQDAVLSRNSLAPQHRDRPVFGWCDEAQDTVTSRDAYFLGLARDSMCCPVYMTQSLPAYYGKIGGDNPREEAQALMGKFGTHVFLTNSCPETNEYAARMIGKVVTRRGTFNAGTSRNVNFGMSSGANESDSTASNYGYSFGHQGGHGGHNSNRTHGSGHTRGTGSNWGENRGQGRSESENSGYSEAMEYRFEPGDFGRLLKTGGPANDNIVTGVWYQSGEIFNTKDNTFIARFKQR